MYIRIVPKEIKDMLKSIASDAGVEYGLVEDVYFHEFGFVAKEMESANKPDPSSYKNILLKHFGSFLSNEQHINKLIEIKNAKNTKNTETSV